MTDHDIHGAKLHFEYGVNCDIFSEPVRSYAKAALWAFEEVERQKAEIERLQRLGASATRKMLNARDKAIKEFAERLKESMLDIPLYGRIVREFDIECLAKEMAGERE